MEKLVEKGLVRSIGLSNFNGRQIDDVLSVASIKPTVLQVRAAFSLQTDLMFTRRASGLTLWWLLVCGRWRDTLTWLRWSCWPTVGTGAWWWRPTVLWDLLTAPGNIQTNLFCCRSPRSSASLTNTKSRLLKLSWGDFALGLTNQDIEYITSSYGPLFFFFF